MWGVSLRRPWERIYFLIVFAKQIFWIFKNLHESSPSELVLTEPWKDLDFFLKVLLSFISTGLKHVSDAQKTHKNPALKGQGAPVRTGPKPFSSAAPRPAASATPTRTLPPVLELEGKKWKVVSCCFTLSTEVHEKLQPNVVGREGRNDFNRCRLVVFVTSSWND